MMNGLGKLDLQWVAGVSVEVKDLGNDQKTIGIRWDFTNSNENLTGFVARSGRNLTRFDEILLDSVKISPDLEIFTENCLVTPSVRVFWVLGEENLKRPIGVNF